MNQLYYGDNLHVLRESIATESVDHSSVLMNTVLVTEPTVVDDRLQPGGSASVRRVDGSIDGVAHPQHFAVPAERFFDEGQWVVVRHDLLVIRFPGINCRRVGTRTGRWS